MKARGMVPSSKLLSFEIIAASEKIAEQLQISLHAPVYEIKRIRLADDVPMALESVYVSANLVKGLTESIVNDSLYRYIEEELGLKIGEANQTLESILASETEVKHLGISSYSPVLLIQRNTYLQDGTPLEVVKSSYRADRYKFTINMTRS
jgi:GntR family transcriptional regulator